MIRRLLVANRGEIAVRVARAAREMGIAPLGIYSEADAGAYHLHFMNDARCVGAAPAALSYLNAEAVIAAAKRLGADALHPGYGFLSESAAFAAAVRDAGITFVGPPHEAMQASGSKIEAKRRAAAAGVPTIAGYDGDDQTPQRLRAEAERLGFPVLIKASAGGGGRGMRLVCAAREFDEALSSARREASAAFGDDDVLLERYLENPRHIEFQILADAHGAFVHLGERECSIQRRHQKVVEEAPSVALTSPLRAEMGDAAVRVASSIGYVNAGTVEFMLDGSGYYFLEMNARLQVEHPVTEAVYGIDLVQWQLRIAAGESLALRQEELSPRGWAIEMRLTAEDPASGMLPSSGRIARWDEPDGPGIRIDAGVRAGSDVGLDYDSMLAKVIVSAADRAAAISRMQRALDDFRIDGVRTNLPLLAWIARNEDFRAGAIDTGFLERHLDESIFAPHAPPQPAVLIAIAAQLLDDAMPWRLGAVGRPIFLIFEGGTVEVWASAGASMGWILDGDLAGTIEARREGGEIEISFGGERRRGRASRNGDEIVVAIDERSYVLRRAQPLAVHTDAAGAGTGGDGTVAAPMPGRVVRVAVAAGDAVEPHQLLVVLEAMKMEHRIEASLAATVRAVLVDEGAIVAGGTPLVELGN
jgi:3-methylcrotonyl-CoA carboxylase alpha subunit